MEGIQYIRLYTKRYKYELEIKHKITIIRGDSGTGKSTLVKTAILALNSLIENKSTSNLEVLKGIRKERIIDTLKSYNNAIVIIDEEVPLLNTHEFAEAINKSDCYFVIITRRLLSYITYSISEVYKIERDSNNLHTLEAMYLNEDVDII